MVDCECKSAGLLFEALPATSAFTFILSQGWRWLTSMFPKEKTKLGGRAYPALPAKDETEQMQNTINVIIYTDGSAAPNPGGGGWAALLIYGDAQKEISGSKAYTTNNEMELTAAVKALEALNRPCAVELHTDSSYMRNGITKWIYGWLKNGWKTSKGTPVENQALWAALHELTQKHQITWKWVKGHSTNAFNQRVDELANEARKKKLNPLP